MVCTYNLDAHHVCGLLKCALTLHFNSLRLMPPLGMDQIATPNGLKGCCQFFNTGVEDLRGGHAKIGIYEYLSFPAAYGTVVDTTGGSLDRQWPGTVVLLSPTLLCLGIYIQRENPWHCVLWQVRAG